LISQAWVSAWIPRLIWVDQIVVAAVRRVPAVPKTFNGLGT